MKEISGIRFCAHCGHRSPQKVVYEHVYPDDFYEQDDGLWATFFGRYFVVICETCSKISIYNEECTDTSNSNSDLEKSFYSSKLLWPNIVKLDPLAIPKKILEIYEEASKVKLLAPSAFVVEIRRALEAICLEQGIVNRHTLHSKLQELTNKGKLPPLLSKVTNIIKIIGNAGAHAEGPPVSSMHVLAIDDFFRVVLEYLYVAPHKLKNFEKEVSKFKYDWRDS